MNWLRKWWRAIMPWCNQLQQHMENFRRAGLEPVAGQEVVAVKVEKSEPAPFSFAQILKSER